MREQPATNEIAVIAEAQAGVISVHQLRLLGLDKDAIRRRVQSGWLQPMHRGVYAAGHRRPDASHRWFGAVLACGPGAVLSHRSAAARWDVASGGGGMVHVTVPSANGRERHRGVRLHRCAGLRAEEATVHHGLPITVIERTLLDIANLVTPRQLEKALESAEAQRLVDHDVLSAYAFSGRRGARRLRMAMAAPPTVTRSVLEDRFLRLCERHGVPRPLVNHRVGGFEVDFLWPAERLIVETDGHRHHGTRAAFEEDRRRDAALTVMGFRVVRFTHRQVMKRGAATARTVMAWLAV